MTTLHSAVLTQASNSALFTINNGSSVSLTGYKLDWNPTTMAIQFQPGDGQPMDYVVTIQDKAFSITDWNQTIYVAIPSQDTLKVSFFGDEEMNVRLMYWVDNSQLVSPSNIDFQQDSDGDGYPDFFEAFKDTDYFSDGPEKIVFAENSVLTDNSGFITYDFTEITGVNSEPEAIIEYDDIANFGGVAPVYEFYLNIPATLPPLPDENVKIISPVMDVHALFSGSNRILVPFPLNKSSDPSSIVEVWHFNSNRDSWETIPVAYIKDNIAYAWVDSFSPFLVTIKTETAKIFHTQAAWIHPKFLPGDTGYYDGFTKIITDAPELSEYDYIQLPLVALDEIASNRQNLVNTISQVIQDANTFGLKVIPVVPMGSRHSYKTAWLGLAHIPGFRFEINTIDMHAEYPSVKDFVSTDIYGAPSYTDKDFALVFQAVLSVLNDAYQLAISENKSERASQQSLGQPLSPLLDAGGYDYINMGGDEFFLFGGSVNGDDLLFDNRLVFGLSSQKDKNALEHEINQNGLSKADAVKKLIQEFWLARITDIQASGKYVNNAKGIIWADCYDPQKNGRLGFRLEGDTSSEIVFATGEEDDFLRLKDLSERDRLILLENIILAPWNYSENTADLSLISPVGSVVEDHTIPLNYYNNMDALQHFAQNSPNNADHGWRIIPFTSYEYPLPTSNVAPGIEQTSDANSVGYLCASIVNLENAFVGVGSAYWFGTWNAPLSNHAKLLGQLDLIHRCKFELNLPLNSSQY